MLTVVNRKSGGRGDKKPKTLLLWERKKYMVCPALYVENRQGHLSRILSQYPVHCVCTRLGLNQNIR